MRKPHLPNLREAKWISPVEICAPALQSSLLASIFWFCMQICLVFDIILSMCLTTRDFQEGTVRSYAVVAVFQVPIVVGYLITITQLTDDCTSWWTTIRISSLVPSIISVVLHLVSTLLAWHYSQIETRRTALLAHTHPKKKSKKRVKTPSLPPAATTTTPTFPPPLGTPKPYSPSPPPLYPRPSSSDKPYNDFHSSESGSGSDSDSDASSDGLAASSVAGRPAWKIPFTGGRQGRHSMKKRRNSVASTESS
ncbi:hypothetical protein MNV49_004421 [Pseudohyphozyma bogoriensis]|nr:hypothetical protein MNV49_004421 [Pseudohyphozyma bogoriensis]